MPITVLDHLSIILTYHSWSRSSWLVLFRITFFSSGFHSRIHIYRGGGYPGGMFPHRNSTLNITLLVIRVGFCYTSVGLYYYEMWLYR